MLMINQTRGLLLEEIPGILNIVPTKNLVWLITAAAECIGQCYMPSCG
jgi:hypothetical protein